MTPKRLTSLRISTRTDAQVAQLAELYQDTATAVIALAVDHLHSQEHERLHNQVTAGQLAACPWCGKANA